MSETKEDYSTATDQVQPEEKVTEKLIPVNQIIFSPTNGRSKDAAADEELKNDIKANGLINAITVRCIPDSYPEKYELIAGERRLRACRELGNKSIRASVHDYCPDVAAESLQISENLHRKNLKPLEELKYYQHLRESLSVEDIADRIGKTVNYMQSILQLDQLIPDFMKFLKDDTLPIAQARIISKFPKEVQKALYQNHNIVSGDKIIENLATPAALKKYIFEHVTIPLNTACFALNDTQIDKKAGDCNTCPFNTKANSDLFIDIQEEALCTKGSCFNAKSFKHIEIRSNVMRKTKQPFKYLYEDNYSPGPKKIVEKKYNAESTELYDLRDLREIKKGFTPDPDKPFTIGIVVEKAYRSTMSLGQEFLITPKAKDIDGKKTKAGKDKKSEKEETPIEMRERRMLSRFEKEDDLDKLEVRKLILKELFEKTDPTVTILHYAATSLMRSIPELSLDYIRKDYKIKGKETIADKIKTGADLLELTIKCYAASELNEFRTKEVNLTDSRFDKLINAAGEYAINIKALHDPFIEKRKKERAIELEDLKAAKIRASAKSQKENKEKVEKSREKKVDKKEKYVDPVPGIIPKIARKKKGNINE
jgi:ParB family chromosome partitioning protein